MLFLEYFRNQNYILGKNDCWTFTQFVFEKEKGIKLPDLPIIDDSNEGYLKSNIPHKRVDKAHLGCLVFVKTKEHNHAGYALSDKEYLHKTVKSPIVSKIPKNAEIYEILL